MREVNFTCLSEKQRFLIYFTNPEEQRGYKRHFALLFYIQIKNELLEKGSTRNFTKIK